MPPYENRILIGDAATTLATLPSGIVQTCVTSPPYFGLRDYGIGGQIGLEKSIQEYVHALVGVFGEVRRVLRDDGTLWVNIGDSYAGVPIHAGEAKTEVEHKAKNLLGIPWRLALALQDDGWCLRTEIIWHKPNGMPDAVKDRPTRAHEYVFLLTKGDRYYYDSYAIREQDPETLDHVNSPNRRSVWSIPTRSYAGSHLAVFPPELPATCIKAGSSESGVCSDCGTPWTRLVEEEGIVSSGKGRTGAIHTNKYRDRYKAELGASGKNETGSGFGRYLRKDLGFHPGCKCGALPRPCIVLDPFAGSGTTLATARGLLRSYIGIELNPAYKTLIEARLREADDKGAIEREGFAIAMNRLPQE